MVGLNWEAIPERLKLHDLWNRDVESKLTICEAALIEVVLETRETETNGKEP